MFCTVSRFFGSICSQVPRTNRIGLSLITCLSLSLLVGCGDPWTTMGGGNNHLGKNMAFQGMVEDTPDWTIQLPGYPNLQVSPIVSTGIRTIYLTTTKGRNMLHGIHRFDGGIYWSYDFGMGHTVGYPAVRKGSPGDQSSQDRVYVAVASQRGMAALYCFDAQQGGSMTGVQRLLWQTSFSASNQIFWSPIVCRGRVYVGGGLAGGLTCFNANTGALQWQQPYGGPGQSWSPSYWQNIFTFTCGELRRHDPITGTVQQSMSLPAGGTSNGTYSVVWGSDTYLVSDGQLRKVRLSTATVTWATSGESITGVPAFDPTLRQVYAVNAGSLDARNAQNGSLLWNFNPGDTIVGHTVLAQDMVYVSTRDRVYGLNPATGSVLWQGLTGIPWGAQRWLLIYGKSQDGRLFVAGDPGVVRSFRK